MNNIPVIFRLACHNSRSITTNVGGYSGNKTLLLAFGGQGGWQAQGSAWALSVSFGPFTSGQTDARTSPLIQSTSALTHAWTATTPGRQHECVSELARERQAWFKSLEDSGCRACGGRLHKCLANVLLPCVPSFPKWYCAWHCDSLHLSAVN